MTQNIFEVTRDGSVVMQFNKCMFLMGRGLVTNDFLRSDFFLCPLAPQTSSFELSMCEWHLDQLSEPATWARLQAWHKITSCSLVKDWSNNSEGGKFKLMHSY